LHLCELSIVLGQKLDVNFIQKRLNGFKHLHSHRTRFPSTRRLALFERRVEAVDSGKTPKATRDGLGGRLGSASPNFLWVGTRNGLTVRRAGFTKHPFFREIVSLGTCICTGTAAFSQIIGAGQPLFGIWRKTHAPRKHLSWNFGGASSTWYT